MSSTPPNAHNFSVSSVNNSPISRLLFASDSRLNNSVYKASLAFHGYHILNVELGDGSCGKVKLAKYRGQEIAVKILCRSYTSWDSTNKFLAREVEILREVQHDNIVKIFRIFDYPTKVYIFMELIGGGSLYTLLKNEIRLTEPQARLFFRQMVSALQYLHNREIAHRDIKCENIMLTTSGQIRVIDFGFCKRLDPTGWMSRTFCGSTAYAAPEVLQGIPYDPLMYDIWSLGCVLYVMVTGTMPFDESNILTMVENQMKKRLKYPTACYFSSPLLALIDSMLEPDVSLRMGIDDVDKSPWVRDEFDDQNAVQFDAGPSASLLLLTSSSDSLGMLLDGTM